MNWTRSSVVATALLVIGLSAVLLRPSISATSQTPQLEQSMPAAFGEWRLLPNPLVQASVVAQGATSTDQPYDEVVSRSYVNSRGDVVMLALAYGKNQRQEVKVHRPELCYPAQGFKVLSLKPAQFDGIRSPLTGQDVTGQRMVVDARGSKEVVSYWIRIGDTYSSNPWRIRWQILEEGLQGRMTDGILVRVSQRMSLEPGADLTPHHQRLEGFARDLVASLPESTSRYLVR